MEDNMEDVHADETREARLLMMTAFETVPDDPAAVGGLLRAVRRRHARRRRSRALMLAGGAAAAAGTAAVALLSLTVDAAPPALASVTSALSQAEAGSFHMNLTVTTAPAQGIPSPLYITGELDLKRNLGKETISNGWQTLIVGGNAYTKILPSQTKQYGTGGKLWTKTPLWVAAEELPYKSAGGQLAWDFNSNRPFNPQAVLAVLNSDARALDDEGPVSGPGWTGTRYRFTVSHPQGTGGLVDSITCTMDVDRQGRIRSLTQTTVFVAGTTYTADFTFSDFGIRFSVTPPPASQTSSDIGVGALQF
jgi:hypothetical protein